MYLSPGKRWQKSSTVQTSALRSLKKLRPLPASRATTLSDAPCQLVARLRSPYSVAGIVLLGI
jgi:hypothetical protein